MMPQSGTVAQECPLVSVIVAVRNGERYLPAALDSIRWQTYRPLEILVVDGQSTDGTAAIARAVAEARYLLQPDHGIANAYNLGLQQARGAYVAFLSHDDLWLPEKLAAQVGCLEARPASEFCVCRIRYFLEPGHTLPPGFRPELLTQEPVAYIMETLVARRSLFDRVGVYAAHLKTAEDIDWYARVFDAGVRGWVCDQVLVEKRVHDANTSLAESDNNKHILHSLRRSVQRKRGVEVE